MRFLALLLALGCSTPYADGDRPFHESCSLITDAGTTTWRFRNDGGPVDCCSFTATGVSFCGESGAHCCYGVDSGFAGYCCLTGARCNALSRECL